MLKTIVRVLTRDVSSLQLPLWNYNEFFITNHYNSTIIL